VLVALRSLAFTVTLYSFTWLMLLVIWPFFLLPKRRAWPLVKLWGTIVVGLHRFLGGTRVEWRGLENIPPGGFLVAAKHQAMWETFALIPMFSSAAFVLKHELGRIPIFGFGTRQMGMIAIDRSAGARALIDMTQRAKEAIAEGRQVIIFPEGTRTAPGAPPAYKVGVGYIYEACGATCLPVALNSGLYWPRRSWLRYPGTIIVEFLPPIPPGMPRREFLAKLEHDIEAASNRLIAEAAESRTPPPIPALAQTTAPTT
jgi:1-acyl-sn-glycerol-3-phosphate acyltransferase